MQNPWHELPDTSPFVLQQDKAIIDQHNAAAKPEHQIRLKVLPEPFLGNPEAPVVLLNLNPGFSIQDIAFHRQPAFAELSRDNLLHCSSPFAFYLLDPRISKAPGYEWWRKRLRVLIEDCGLERVANNIFCIELFPYHSEKFKPLSVPSQQYSFQLVRRALKRRAIIVQMRGKSQWFKHVPELRTYERWFKLKNPRSAYITPNNCPTGYPVIVSALQNAG